MAEDSNSDAPPSTEEQVRAVLDPEGLFASTAQVFEQLGGQYAALANKHSTLLAEAARAFDLLSPRGWGVVNFPTPALKDACDLFERGEPDAADVLLADLFDEPWRAQRAVERVRVLGAADHELRALSAHRHRLLLKAAQHHRAGAYEASVPIVLAQIEGITADVAENRPFFSRRPGRAADVIDPTRLAGIAAGLAAVRLVYTSTVDQTQATGALSRHGVLHGRELAYDTKVTSAKAWSLLDVVVEWAMPLANEIAQDRRRADRARHAGSDDLDERGRRLDIREFPETRHVLYLLLNNQLSHHRAHHRFHGEPSCGRWQSADYVRRGLPAAHGVQSRTSANGQSWWAWRRTASGWVLGVALVSPAPEKYTEYRYAGRDEPLDGPGDGSAVWGAPGDTPPDWQGA